MHIAVLMFIDQPFLLFCHRLMPRRLVHIPLVFQFLRGVFHLRPSLPRYTETWDISNAICFLKSLENNSVLPTKMLTHELAMLLSLTVPSRCSELAARDLRFRRFYPQGVVFNLAALTKTVRTGQALKACFHTRFNEDLDLCPCACLEEYERRTMHPEEPNILFLYVIKPFKPVSLNTIARWIKEILALSDIDTDVFKAHSTRGAAATAAADKGVSISEILQLGDWSQVNTFQKFYYRPQFNS